jgi:hypothetical protein
VQQPNRYLLFAPEESVDEECIRTAFTTGIVVKRPSLGLEANFRPHFLPAAWPSWS